MISEAVRLSAIKTRPSSERKMYNAEGTIVSGSGTAEITSNDKTEVSSKGRYQ